MPAHLLVVLQGSLGPPASHSLLLSSQRGGRKGGRVAGSLIACSAALEQSWLCLGLFKRVWGWGCNSCGCIKSPGQNWHSKWRGEVSHSNPNPHLHLPFHPVAISWPEGVRARVGNSCWHSKSPGMSWGPGIGSRGEESGILTPATPTGWGVGGAVFVTAVF